MGGFLYFIPEHVTSVRQLDEWGLSYVFEKDGRGFYPCQGKGVEGVQGTVIGDERATQTQRITYKAAEQTWRKIAGDRSQGKPCFVGFYNDAAPTPEELLRKDALGGHAIRLGDGNDWIIPVARGAAEEGGELRYFAKVPRRLELDENGAWISGTIVDRYAELWAVACKFWDAFTGAGVEKTADGVAMRMEFNDLVNGAMTALSTNYRVRASEAALLGLLDEECCGAILRAVIDWPTVEAFVQKKTQETQPEVAG